MYSPKHETKLFLVVFFSSNSFNIFVPPLFLFFLVSVQVLSLFVWKEYDWAIIIAFIDSCSKAEARQWSLNTHKWFIVILNRYTASMENLTLGIFNYLCTVDCILHGQTTVHCTSATLGSVQCMEVYNGNNEAKSCKVGSGNICRVKTVQCPKIVNQNNILEVVPTYFGFRKWQTKK